LAISDTIHTQIIWRMLTNFYIVLGGLIHSTVHSAMQTWIAHELIEALFHFCILSLVFLSLEIGILAAGIHFVIDIFHSMFIRDMPEIPHRAMHFIIESLFFILIFGL
ncbi:hypothetical protein LJB96_04995, partial [Methanobrevibacter sp. OttesenSCG-928-K11]|nr:hypothetical protein [Methanobrevibacter sp. OttesenSCG-928-K11]